MGKLRCDLCGKLETVDRERSERKVRKEKTEEKDNGNHGQPHPWRQGCQEEKNNMYVTERE